MRRDAHGKAITLPAPAPLQLRDLQPQLRPEPCRGLPSVLLPSVPSLHICKSARRQRCQQTALKNLLQSSWDVQIQQNQWQIAQDLVGKALPCPVMENRCTTLYAILANLILRNHPVKIRLKKNKITVVTIQFSSQPICPPSLLFSRQYFII